MQKKLAKPKIKESDQKLHQLLEELVVSAQKIYGPHTKIVYYYFPIILTPRNIKHFSGWTRISLVIQKKEKIVNLIPLDYSKKIAEFIIDTDMDYVYIDIIDKYLTSFLEIIKLFEKYISSGSVYVKAFKSMSMFRGNSTEEKEVEIGELLPEIKKTTNGLNGS